MPDMTWTRIIKTASQAARLLSLHPTLRQSMASSSFASTSNARRSHRRRDNPPENVVWPTESSLLIVDLEGTCWETNPPPNQFHEIIEIGWALVDLESVPPRHVRSGTVLVKPVRSEVSPFCTKLTTITAELLDSEGVSLKEAFETLVSDVGSKEYSWSSWGAYDRNMIKRQCKVFGLESPFSPIHYNIKDLFKELYPNLNGGYGMTNAFAAVCDGPIEGTHHRGGDDAKNIGTILGKLIVKKRALEASNP